MPNMMILESTLTCPSCGYVATEKMTLDSLLWFYKCKSCHSMIKPKCGNCCVFCSFGTVKCPSMQRLSLPKSLRTF
ncbi:GDCCVxC domain-containing (seleno)protein [Methylotenera sp.]|uniref:GDCCVxC domain-containing (seleno)protein n=1 Tax=Methylotenera sp. TaxID=2051956 RepID=UPI003524CA90